MKLGLMLLAVSSLTALGACPPNPFPPEPPIVIVEADGGVYDEPPDMTSGGYSNLRCARGCANLQSNKCPDGFHRPGEDSCYVVCKRSEATGKIDFNLDCIIGAKNQVEIRACRTYRCQ